MRRTLTALTLATFAPFFGLFSASAFAKEQVINLYSPRHYSTEQAHNRDFTKDTRLKLNRVASE